jgi:protein TonB
MDAPPPPFIPPPEVQIATPPPAQPTITTTATPPPQGPVTIAPQVPVATAPAPAPARPSVMAIGVACQSMVQPTMPRKALAEGISGTVTAQATIRGGKVVAVDIVSSNPRGVFDSAVRNAMMQYGCQTTGTEEIKASQTFDFKVGD